MEDMNKERPLPSNNEKAGLTMHHRQDSSSPPLPPFMTMHTPERNNSMAGHPFAPPFQIQQQNTMMPPTPYFPFANQYLPMMSSATQQGAIQEGWTAHRSEDSIYYFNTITGVSQWERPFNFHGDESSMTEKPKPVATEPIPNTNWIEIKCRDGRVYYHKTDSKETVWNVPLEVTQARDSIKRSKIQEPTIVLNMAPKVQITPTARVRITRKATEDEIAEFIELLNESGVNAYSRFEKEAQILEHDPRWQAIALQKQKKHLFDEFCKSAAKEEVDTKQKAKSQFYQLMKEIRVAEIEQMQMDDETRDVALRESVYFYIGSLLHQIEKHYKDDPRYMACSESVRQEIFSRFCQGLNLQRHKSVTEIFIQNEKLKERHSSERQKLLNRERKDSEQRLRKASHATALSNYKTLLTELVKQPNCSWHSMKDKLESDIQGRGKDPNLEDIEKKNLFSDHIKELDETSKQEYKRLLEEKLSSLTPPPELELDNEELEDFNSRFRTFEAAEKLLVMDPRALQPNYDIKRRLWRQHISKLGGKPESDGERDHHDSKKRRYESSRRSHNEHNFEEKRSRHNR